MNEKPPVIVPQLPPVVHAYSPPRRRSIGDILLRIFGWCFIVVVLVPMGIAVLLALLPDTPSDDRVDPVAARQMNHEGWTSNLVAEIEASHGKERESKLKELITAEPNTEEFPEEVAKIREEEQKLKAEADQFVKNGVGKKVPYEKWSVYGQPSTLKGTDNKYWVAYLAKIDVSFVSDKNTDKVVFVGYTKNSAPNYLEGKVSAREQRLATGFSSWDGSHRGLTKVIKESMNDPKSYKHVETVYWDRGDHLIVRTTFRGRNAFGGVVKNWVKAETDLNGNVVKIIEQGP